MARTEIMMQMKKMIEANPGLAVSDWQGTCRYVVGQLVSLETKDLQEIDLQGVLKPGEKIVLPIELLVSAAATSFGMNFHLQAAEEGLVVDSAEVKFYATVNKAQYLGVEQGNGGIMNPIITLEAHSAAPKGRLAEMAALAVERSPILTGLKQPVALHII